MRRKSSRKVFNIKTFKKNYRQCKCCISIQYYSIFYWKLKNQEFKDSLPTLPLGKHSVSLKYNKWKWVLCKAKKKGWALLTFGWSCIYSKYFKNLQMQNTVVKKKIAHKKVVLKWYFFIPLPLVLPDITLADGRVDTGWFVMLYLILSIFGFFKDRLVVA